MMRTLIRNIVSHTYQPMLKKYLAKTRPYRYKDIRLDIPPQVFHPGFFFSTQLLLQYMNGLQLAGKRILELGCGSGLIAIAAAKRGAVVTATDINPFAVEALRTASSKNGVTLRILESDLFKNIPPTNFDIILINPPYYKQTPVTAKDHAWYCGEQGEYFEGLFRSLAGYTHPGSEVLMVLFDGCDIPMIEGFAAANDFGMALVHSKQNLLEKNFIYAIKKRSSK